MECASPLALGQRARQGRRANARFGFSEVLRKAVEGYRSPRRFATTHALEPRLRLGVRQSSGALAAGVRGMDECETVSASARTEKSGGGLPRSKTLRDLRRPVEVRQVLECASPLALWRRAWNDGRSNPFSQPHQTRGEKRRRTPTAQDALRPRNRIRDFHHSGAGSKSSGSCSLSVLNR